jgi:putative sterol carrier protein
MAANAREFFETLENEVDPARTAGVNHSYIFDVEGVGMWLVDVHDGSLKVTEGDGDADVRISVTEEDFMKINRGELKPTTAFMSGKMKVKGDFGAATKLEAIL